MTRSALNPMRVGSLNEPNEKVWCASSRSVLAACMPVVEDVLHQDISSRAASSEIW